MVAEQLPDGVQRLPDEVLASFAPHVLKTADAISVRLGYRSRAAF